MRRIALILLLVAGTMTLTAAAQPARQTARQALLEMFFGKPGSFEKHLPEATKAALRQVNDSTSQLQMFSMIASQLSSQGHLQTFEAGSTLVAVEDPKTQSRFEINVEKDDLRGNEDEIELSFHGVKAGETQDMHVTPRLTFLMKSEAGVWRMNEISFRITVPLADPDFLKSAVANMKQRQAMMASAAMQSQASAQMAPAGPMQPANESGALASLRTILTAEVTYAATYPARGYTCFLSDLDGFGEGSPNEHQAMLIESRLAGGKKHGYVFTISNCSQDPATHFQITAVPATPGAGRSFCSDESAVIRFASDGSPATCLHAGRPLQ